MQPPTIQRTPHRNFNQCARKVSHENKRAADNEAANLRRRADFSGSPRLRAYHCGICGNWHVGNDKPTRNERAAERAAQRRREAV